MTTMNNSAGDYRIFVGAFPNKRIWSILSTLSVLTSVLIVAMLRATTPGPALAANSLPVYTDSLDSSWGDWSWGGLTRNLANTSPVHGGTASIAITYTGGWSGLQFGRNNALDVSAYDILSFWIHGGNSGGQRIQVSVGNSCSSATLSVPAPPVNTWMQVDVPLRELGNPRQVTYISWFNSTPGAQSTFYLDDIAFTASGAPTPAPSLAVGPILSVDAQADRHVISPYIYGMNFTDEALAAELHLPVRRWGGNATTRYNWQNDTSNTGSDWYFENIPNDNPHPEQLPDGSSSDRFVEQDRRTGAQTLMTVPLIGWTAKRRVSGHPYDCGFRVSAYGAQQSVDPWDVDCGNGVRTDGTTVITGNNPLDTSTAITPTFVQNWISHLVGKYGTAANGGVQFYDLDNEPMLWNSTHRDVHLNATSYDELYTRTVPYASAIKAIDATARTLGPVLWGWTAYFYSALDITAGGSNWWDTRPDRKNHGDIPFVPWYLQQMRTYEQQHGQRILDYLDLHYYPQGNGIFSNSAGDGNTQALRLRSTRSLWDPTYADESWIAGTEGGPAVQLIPRMREWVTSNYTGTQLAISEYSWGALCHINGALAQADVLGIFGREALDLATLWGPPTSTQPGAFAFRLYRNYDSASSAFGDISVRAGSANQDQVAIYAAQRSSDSALTLMVVNKITPTLTTTVTLSGFTPAGMAQVFQYSADSLDAIVRQPDLAVTVTSLTTTLPGSSITLVVIPSSNKLKPRVYLPLVIRP